MSTITGNTLQEIVTAFAQKCVEVAQWKMGPMEGELVRNGNTCEMKNSRGVTIHKWEA